MENKHISICPICGSRNLIMYVLVIDEREDKVYCSECEKEVIPLVTPQEER